MRTSVYGTKPQCDQCKDVGYYYRLPQGMNPFAASIEVTARNMRRIQCDCFAGRSPSKLLLQDRG
jgi:hypothetical protein